MSNALPDSAPGWARPIRIPETIEITHAEPAWAMAGEVSSWLLPFRLSKDVAAGSVLKFQFFGGRNNKGIFSDAQTTDPAGDGYLSAHLDDGAPLTMSPAQNKGAYVLNLPSRNLKQGQMLGIRLGDRAGGGKGIQACSKRLLNKFFLLYIEPDQDAGTDIQRWPGNHVWNKATSDAIVAACSMHILGGPISRLRAYVASAARPMELLAVLARPEDKFGNLSFQTPGPLAVRLDGKTMPATWAPVTESTCALATVRLPAAGVCRLDVSDTRSGLAATTNPTICSAAAQSVFWGMIHGHTEMSDGTGKLDQYFHQLRNEVLLDFAAPGDHDHLWETSDEYWAVTRDAVKRRHKPHEFVVFLGYEWAKWRRNGDGDRNVYYLEDDRPLYRSDDGEYPSPPDLFRALADNGEKAIVIPHHTGHGGNFCDWKRHSPEHERLVEIFQVRGSYECPAQDGNPLPEKPGVIAPFPDGYVQNALALGWRVGFTAGGDDHDGQWGAESRLGADYYTQGLMSVEAEERTRQAIFDAMRRRRVTATTGARMLLAYNMAGHAMGSELSIKAIPDLARRRTLSIEFHGTAPVDKIDIMRNNRVAHSTPGNGNMDMLVTWEDAAPIEDVVMPAAPFCPHPFVFYYVRVAQTDGEIAWASPIWIDP